LGGSGKKKKKGSSKIKIHEEEVSGERKKGRAHKHSSVVEKSIVLVQKKSVGGGASCEGKPSTIDKVAQALDWAGGKGELCKGKRGKKKRGQTREVLASKTLKMNETARTRRRAHDLHTGDARGEQGPNDLSARGADKTLPEVQQYEEKSSRAAVYLLKKNVLAGRERKNRWMRGRQMADAFAHGK